MEKQLKLDDLLGKADISKKLGDLSFESGIQLLEELVTKVESGQLPLDQSVLAYERGAQILNHLKGLISGVEEKLKIIDLGPGRSVTAKK